MGSLIDYAQQYADVSLEVTPFGEVDALVLATLVYMPLGIACARSQEEGTPLDEVARCLLACGGGTGFPMAAAKDRALLEALLVGARFARMRLTDFKEQYNGQTHEQFAAATFLCGDEAVIAFRGTDATIVGWKEDFDMSFKLETPAQRSAATYVQRTVHTLGRPMRLCGHSKGGNLAAYAAIFADEATKASITLAYSFDGPGFNEAVAARRARTQDAKLRTYVPQGSVVGVLFWHSEPFTVVKSGGIGLFQHDPYTWQVEDGAFVASQQTLSSRYADATFKEWLSNLPPATRKKAIDGLYEVLSATGEKTLSELLDADSLLKALRSARALDEDTREAISEMLLLLGNAAASTAPDTLRGAAERLGEGAAKSIAERIGEGRREERPHEQTEQGEKKMAGNDSSLSEKLLLLSNAVASITPDTLRDAAERLGEGAAKSVAERIAEGLGRPELGKKRSESEKKTSETDA